MAKKIFFIVMLTFLALGFACLILKLASPVFNYVSIFSLALCSACFGCFQIFKYLDLKKQIENDYPLFLAELYSNGIVTKFQVESVDKAFFKQHKRKYLTLILANIGLVMLGFSLMITLLYVFFAKV